MNELSILHAVAALVFTVIVVATVFIYGERVFRPTCNRCPMCQQVSGKPGVILPDGDPGVCGHEICDACQEDFHRALEDRS
jgi:hypothetical protein